MDFASANLPGYKEVFLICTHGGSAAYQSIVFYDCKYEDTVAVMNKCVKEQWIKRGKFHLIKN